jgi:hypothetical protein
MQMRALPVFQKDPPLPVGVENLKQGDIFLGLSHSPISLLFASGGDASLLKQSEGDAFNHAMILLAPSSQEEEWSLVGMERGHISKNSLKASFPRSRFVAFYRLKEPDDAGVRIAQRVRKFLEDPQVQNATFDYQLKDLPGRRNQFFCLGFVNEVYRTEGFPPPFLPPSPPRSSAMTDEATRLLKTDMGSTLIALDIKNNPSYHRVFFWKNPHLSEDRYWVDVQVFQILETFTAEGWRLKGKGSVLEARVGHLFGIVPSKAVEIDRYESSLSRFYKKIHSTWGRLKRQGRIEGLNEAEKFKLLERICLKYRSEFFKKESE